MVTTHTNREYAAELQRLREILIRMAGRVEEMIHESISSLVLSDSALAKQTIKKDHDVNRSEMEVDQLCLAILARRQPMASDLRFITLTLKMVTDLERIGDLAVNVSERALDLNKEPQLAPYIDIPKMASIVQGMVRDAIDAFVEGDTKKANDVIERDDEVDKLYHDVFQHLLELMSQHSSHIERGIHIQSVAKFLERMADHATNLAEQVIFLVRAKDIRHHGKI